MRTSMRLRLRLQQAAGGLAGALDHIGGRLSRLADRLARGGADRGDRVAGAGAGVAPGPRDRVGAGGGGGGGALAFGAAVTAAGRADLGAGTRPLVRTGAPTCCCASARRGAGSVAASTCPGRAADDARPAS